LSFIGAIAVLGGRSLKEDEGEMSPSTTKRCALLKVETLEDRTAPAVHSLTTAVVYLEAMKVSGPSAIVTADLNRDGRADLAIAHKGTRDVTVRLARPDGSFQDEMRFPIEGSGPDALLVIDFNGTGHLDLVSVALDNNEVFFLAGNGDGTFRKPVPLASEELRAAEAILAGTDTGEGRLPLESGHGADRTTMARGNDVDEPDRVKAVSAESLMQSAAGGGSRTTGEFQRGDAQENEEFAAPTTSPGLSLPFVRLEGRRLSLPDVFVINGPGCTTEAGILSERGAAQESPQDSRDRAEAVPDPAIDESGPNRFRLPCDDVIYPDDRDSVPGRWGIAETLAGTIMIGGFVNDIPITLSKRRNIAI
jgi:hypothetical protein